MAFIQKADLIAHILEDELDEITRSNAAIVTAALDAATAEARMYLFDTFDADTIFSATDNDRNPLLVQLVSDMAIWKIVASCYAGQDRTDRLERYEQAVKWLKAAAKTELYTDLPRRTNNATAEKKMVVGSNPKRGNYY
jgi:phage gp36-like protein